MIKQVSCVSQGWSILVIQKVYKGKDVKNSPNGGQFDSFLVENNKRTSKVMLWSFVCFSRVACLVFAQSLVAFDTSFFKYLECFFLG